MYQNSEKENELDVFRESQETCMVGVSRKGMAEDELDRNEIIRGLVVSSLHFILSVLGNPWKLSKGQ